VGEGEKVEAEGQAFQEDSFERKVVEWKEGRGGESEGIMRQPGTPMMETKQKDGVQSKIDRHDRNART